MLAKILPLVAAVLLAACTQVRSTVTTFHTLPTDSAGKTIAIFPGTDNERNSLENKAYIAKLASRFEDAGFKIVEFEGPEKPDYVALFTYGVDNGTQVARSYAIPQWGVTGYSSSTTTGTYSSYGSYGSYSGTTTYTPRYGVTGYATGTTTDTVFQRALILDIFETDKILPDDQGGLDRAIVYQAKLLSSGSCGSLAGVIDPMLDALFREFPGASSQTYTVDVPMKSSC